MDFLREIYRINNTLADLDDVAHFYWSRARPHRGPPSYDYRTSESGINCGGEMVLRFFQCTHEVASSFSNFPFPPLHSSTARTLGKGWDYPGRGLAAAPPRGTAGPPDHRAGRHGRRPAENGGEGSCDCWACWPCSVSEPHTEQGRGRGREALRARTADGLRRPTAAGTQG